MIGKNAEDVVVADVDSDGDLDIVAVIRGDNAVAVLVNDGFGGFTTAPVGDRPHDLEADDIDGDGVVDLVIDTFSVSQAGSDVLVLFGEGDGTFTLVDSHVVEGPPLALRLADLTGDGVIDIVTSDGPRGVAVLTGRGDGTFTDAVATPTAASAYGIEVGDFDEDGRLDVAVGGTAVTVLAGQPGGGRKHDRRPPFAPRQPRPVAERTRIRCDISRRTARSRRMSSPTMV